MCGLVVLAALGSALGACKSHSPAATCASQGLSEEDCARCGPRPPEDDYYTVCVDYCLGSGNIGCPINPLCSPACSDRACWACADTGRWSYVYFDCWCSPADASVPDAEAPDADAPDADAPDACLPDAVRLDASS